jgi:hypothetical protein
MPNWCENDLVVKGKSKALDEFAKFVEGPNGAFDFEKIIPMPEVFKGVTTGFNTIDGKLYENWREDGTGVEEEELARWREEYGMTTGATGLRQTGARSGTPVKLASRFSWPSKGSNTPSQRRGRRPSQSLRRWLSGSPSSSSPSSITNVAALSKATSSTRKARSSKKALAATLVHAEVKKWDIKNFTTCATTTHFRKRSAMRIARRNGVNTIWISPLTVQCRCNGHPQLAYLSGTKLFA